MIVNDESKTLDHSSWKIIENTWPFTGSPKQKNFFEIKDKLEEFLIKKGVTPKLFGHFGFVVRNIEDSAKFLMEHGLKSTCNIKKDWVEASSLYVASSFFNGIEIEFILPVGKSIFYDFLENEGESLHHIAFQVDKIEKSLKTLELNGANLINKEPKKGSHGRNLFLIPDLLSKIFIELYQPYN